MIDTIAKRRVTFEGKQYAKGETVPMPLQQFNELEQTDMFERAPQPKAEPAPAPKRKPATRTKSRAKAD